MFKMGCPFLKLGLGMRGRLCLGLRHLSVEQKLALAFTATGQHVVMRGLSDGSGSLFVVLSRGFY